MSILSNILTYIDQYLHKYRLVKVQVLFQFSFYLVALLVVISGCTGSLTGSMNSELAPIDTTKLLSISPLTKVVNLGSAISFNVNGGTEPYVFDVYYGGGSVVSSGSVATYQAPLAEGTAVVRVQDAANNIGYATIEITDAPVIQPPSKTLAVTNKFPFVVLNGKVPYTFTVASGNGTINATTGEYTASSSAGTAVIRVTDADGRYAEANVVINSALSFSTKNIYLEKNSNYTLTATGGVAPYTFSIASGAGTIDKNSGIYTAPNVLGVAAVQVFDSIGNSDLALINITTALAINPSSAMIAKGATSQFTVIGGVPPYSYSVPEGSFGSISALTGQYLAPTSIGTNIVRVTDALGHISDANVTITNDLSFNVINLILAVGNTFDISTIVNGGEAPLTYTVPNSQGSFSGSNYTAPNTPGAYVITVYDSQTPSPNSMTCVVTVNAALTLLPNASSVAIGTQKSFSASGGVPPYSYSVQSGEGNVTSSGLFTAPNNSGSTIILVTDIRGNTATATISVQDALAIVPTSKTLNTSETFTFTATGGIPPYTYSVVSGFGVLNSASGLYTAPASAGLTTVQVEDSTGVKKEALVTILNQLSISPPTISLIKNASITFTASGGAGPYSFSLASGDGSIDASSGVFVASASPGASTVRVTDSLGNIKDATVTIYDGLSISPFTKTLAIGQSFTFTATGGVPPYVYSLASGVGGISSAGVYSASTGGAAVVRVTDASGNTSDATIAVNSILTISPANKIIAVNNSITFNASGGAPPYYFAIVSGGGTVTAAGDYKAPNTSSSAIIRVTDSFGSTADATVTVNDQLTISPANATLAAGGQQNYISAGGVGPYVYKVVSGGGSFTNATYTAPAIASGASVEIAVTDTLGNTANASIIINPILVEISSPNSSAVITSSNKAAFSVSGKCSEVGRLVTVSATDGTNVTATSTSTCTAGTWSTSIDLETLNDTSVTITATHLNINNVAATPASVTLAKDSSTPTITIITPAANSYVGNSITVTGVCAKTGPVNIAAGTGVTAVTTCSSNSYSASLNLSSLTDGAISITANHTDTAGNAATPASVNVTKDSIAPTITAFTVTNTSPTTTTTYNLNFTASDNPSYYCILENSTTIGNCAWQSAPLPTSFIVSTTQNAKILSAWVKDLAGNISARVDSLSVTLNTTILWPTAPTSLSLANPTTSPNTIATPSILVGGVSVGDTISLYTDSGCTSSNLKGTAVVITGTTVSITSTTLTDNTYNFYAKAVNSSNRASPCSTATVAYTLTSPQPPTIKINNGALYTAFSTVTLSFTADGAVGLYVTNVAGCNSGGSSEAFVSSKSWSLANTNATNTVYVNFMDAGGTTSSCISASILHDSVAPNAPTGLSLGSVPVVNPLATTPTLIWTAATDNTGGSGVASYQVQVYKTSDNSIVLPWVASTSGSAVATSSGVLLNGTQYYLKVRAVDNAGNFSAESAASANWTTYYSCTKTISTGTFTVTVPSAVSLFYTMYGGGGGSGAPGFSSQGNGGGGGGGSSAILVAGTLVAYASGGKGGDSTNTGTGYTVGSAGSLENNIGGTALSIPAGQQIKFYVGGGGGGGGFPYGAGGGGGAGYYGGGGGGGGSVSGSLTWGKGGGGGTNAAYDNRGAGVCGNLSNGFIPGALYTGGNGGPGYDCVNGNASGGTSLGGAFGGGGGGSNAGNGGGGGAFGGKGGKGGNSTTTSATNGGTSSTAGAGATGAGGTYSSTAYGGDPGSIVINYTADSCFM